MKFNTLPESVVIEELSGDFFQQLRGFYYTAQTGSMRKAAQLMNRNPSTISWQIRQLEQALGTVLFDRYKKACTLRRKVSGCWSGPFPPSSCCGA